MSYEDDTTPPLTPTKSELDTFQVLSNANFVDFKKEKPTSKTFHSPTGSPKLSPKASPKALPKFEYEYDKLEENVTPPDTPRLNPTLEKLYIPEDEDKDYPLPTRQVPNPPQIPAKDDFEMPQTFNGFVHPVEPPSAPPQHTNPTTYAPKWDDDKKSVDSISSELENEIEYEKQALLEELRMLEKQGDYRPIKELTMKDTLEEIQFQFDKVQNELSTNQGVQFAISGIKMGSSLLETVLKKFGFGLVDGFSANLCKDPAKFNRPVTKLYKRYWRKGNMSPEAELAMIVLGSLGWTIIQNKMSGNSGYVAPPSIPASKPLAEKSVKSDPFPTPSPMDFASPLASQQVKHAPQLPKVSAQVTAPPKVNLAQFAKEKDMEKKIDELEKKLQLAEKSKVELEEKRVAAENALMANKNAVAAAAAMKKVNLGSRTNSLQSTTSSIKKKPQLIKL